MKKSLMILLVLGAILVFAGCQATDVVGNVAGTSFDAVLNLDPAQVSPDEENNGWTLVSPGGESFMWSKAFDATGKPDLMMRIDASPFLAAGLNTEGLDPAMYQFDASDNSLKIIAEVGDKAFKANATETPISTFKALVSTYRESIGYHEALDHYGVKLGGGNMFEWAKDMAINEIDMVFVLDPKVLIEAGVDPTLVEGWAFAQVEVMDDDGNKIEVDKFLKPYNLK